MNHPTTPAESLDILNQATQPGAAISRVGYYHCELALRILAAVLDVPDEAFGLDPEEDPAGSAAGAEAVDGEDADEEPDPETS